MEFCDLSAQQQRIKPQIDAAIQRVLAHGKYILGPEVDELEEKLANYTGAKYCITCANGTDALQIALMALGVKAGDEVVVPAFSFIATAEAVAILGAVPVFVDINPATYNLDPNLIEAVVTEKTKAIIPVSLYGQCADFKAINAIADKHKLPVIEDAAQSLGATHHGQKSCNLSTMATTSFFPAKPLGCYGDGGAVFTNDEELAKRARTIARHGQTKRYFHEMVGMNSRLDTVQAAILLEKLNIFDDELKERNQVASKLKRGLEGYVHLPEVAPENYSAFAQFTTRVVNRDLFQQKMNSFRVPTAIHYPTPLHKQPAMGNRATAQMPVSEKTSLAVISLPCHSYLTENQLDLIVTAVQQSAKYSNG